MLFAPLGQGDDRVRDGPAERSQAVFDASGNLGIDLAGNESVSFKAAQAVGHHFLRDARQACVQATGAADTSRDRDDQVHLPLSLKQLKPTERPLDQDPVARLEPARVLRPLCGCGAGPRRRTCLGCQHACDDDTRRCPCRCRWRADFGAARGSVDSPGSCIADSPALLNTGNVVKRCLIVDDSQPFLVSARALLESQGMTVAACARSGDDALTIAKNAKPDVALVDVELAGEDGFVLARSLIAQDPALCVILISAYELEDVAELVVGGGADHVVPAAVDRQMAKRQSKSGAVTEYKECPGRSHFTLGQDGWEEVADYALDWAVEHARVPATA